MEILAVFCSRPVLCLVPPNVLRVGNAAQGRTNQNLSPQRDRMGFALSWGSASPAKPPNPESSTRSAKHQETLMVAPGPGLLLRFDFI